MFAYSCCIQDCSTVCGRCCLILLFMMCHTFLIGDRSELQAGQSSTRNLCLRSHAVVTCAEFCIAEIDMEFLGKAVVLTAAFVSPNFQHNLHICEGINGTFTYMQITYAVGTDAPPYHHRGWVLPFSLARRI